jgi:hypothetical protein
MHNFAYGGDVHGKLSVELSLRNCHNPGTALPKTTQPDSPLPTYRETAKN